MRRALSQISQQPFYLWLLGIYPILYLYSENFGLVIEKEVLSCLVWMLIATTIGFLLTNTLLRQAHLTALGLSICSIMFSLAGHLYNLFFYRDTLPVWSLSVVVLTIAIVIGFHRFIGQDLYKQITPVVNVILIALVLSQIVNLVSKRTSVSTIAQSLSTTSALTEDILVIPKISGSAKHPDIYYIIPDGYPSDLWLQDSMNYDNSRFTEALKDRGFTVVPHAQSNYAATLLSLASVLNMRHYHSNPTPLGDLDYLRLSIADSKVARHLLQLGYSYVQFMSGYLIPSPIADINRDFTRDGAIDIGFGQNDFFVEILNETSEGVRDPIGRANWRRQFSAIGSICTPALPGHNNRDGDSCTDAGGDFCNYSSYEASWTSNFQRARRRGQRNMESEPSRILCRIPVYKRQISGDDRHDSARLRP